ncbi:MAG TPA: glycerol-3-phosphate dehydrogenase/oxidase [Gemmatimonadales bacterium]
MDTSFSFAARAAQLGAMADSAVDLLVIGGGVTGAGIARDAAMRGFRTALVERGDFASGTSSRSSRLIHGGLRYLEMGDLRLVFEASRERRTLLHIAPHLVWPRSFLFPIYEGGRVPRWKLAAGLWLYDVLAAFRNVGRHRWLSKRTILRSEPGLRERGLKGGARYWDAQCDDARLTLANVRDAHRHGALAANYAEVTQLEHADGSVRGARVTDQVTGEPYTIRAHVVVNATGPWSDALRDDGNTLLQPTKGVHAAVPRSRIGNVEALTLTSPIDGRVMFILPWNDLAYIGTTDTDHAGSPSDVYATHDDVVYLLRSANAFFPDARLQPDDVVSTWAGLRPLVKPPDPTDPSAVPREHTIVEQPGMISIVGGKLTTYRAMAAEVVDRVAGVLRRLDGRKIPPRAPTASEPLPGGEVRDQDVLVSDALREGASPEVAQHLVRAYGTEAPAVIRLAKGDRRLAEPIVPGHPALRAELFHSIRREMAVTLSDLLIRRTHVFYETANHAVAQAPELVDLVGAELRWDPARKASELAAYLEEAAQGTRFRAEPSA